MHFREGYKIAGAHRKRKTASINYCRLEMRRGSRDNTGGLLGGSTGGGIMPINGIGGVVVSAGIEDHGGGV